MEDKPNETERILSIAAEHGFDRGQLEAPLLELIRALPRSIRLACERWHGEDLMAYELLFLRQNAHYFFASVSATSSRPRREDVTNTFHASNGEHMHAHLIYLELSGAYERLSSLLHPLGVLEVSGERDYGFLARYLKHEPTQFVLTLSRNTPSGYATFSIPVTGSADGYAVEEFFCSLAVYPKLSHGVYNGVNTAELEQDMAAINWSDDGALYEMRDEREPVFFPAVSTVLERLEALISSIPGGYIGAILQLKYMQEPNLSEILIDDETWKVLEALSRMERSFPAETSLLCAANLLAGRAVCRDIPGLPERGEWYQLDLSDKTGVYPVVEIEGYGRRELEALLSCVITADFARTKAAFQLMNGDLLPLRTRQGSIIRVCANPGQRTLDLFTPDQRPIPYNFDLDPNWRMGGAQQQRTNVPKGKRHWKRKKGKGI